jgi:hypothetical protein
MTEIEEKWFKSGYQDGRHGNSPWIPHPADKPIKLAYREGYKKGAQELKAERATR